MEIINRNFFRLLRSGSLNEFVALEPMEQMVLVSANGLSPD